MVELLHSYMLEKLKHKIRSAWYKLSEVPGQFFVPIRKPGSVQTTDEALTLSPVWAALRLYQHTLASLPLVTYWKTADGSREKATTNPAFRVLNERPNPAMTRATFFGLAAKAVFLDGEFFAQIRWRGNGAVFGLYPIPAAQIREVIVDDEWNKAYAVQTDDGVEVYPDTDMIHVVQFSHDGIRGVPLLRYAAESLGLHRQVLESANALYQNAARPSGYIRYPGALNPEAISSLKREFKDEYTGTQNTGKIPVLLNNGEFSAFPTSTAEDAQLIEALGASVADVARWFGVSPLLLGDLSRGTYSNLAADNAAFYQRSVRPLLDMLEQELNAKLFPGDQSTYCEFMTQAVLAGDPAQEQAILNGYIQSGVMTRSEARERLNLPAIPGLDEPLAPVNQAPVTTVPTTEGGSDVTVSETPQSAA